MCYSATSSFGTFLFVLCICIFLWIKGNKIQRAISIILFTISLMQLLEGFIWLNIKCTRVNKILSVFIPIVLYLQPLITLGTVYSFNIGLLQPNIYKYLLFLWILLLPFFVYWTKDIIGKCTKMGKNGHLEWSYQPDTLTIVRMNQIYVIMLGLGIVTINTKWYGIFYGFFSVISNYFTQKMYGRAWSSMWCHFVNILAIGALFI